MLRVVLFQKNFFIQLSITLTNSIIKSKNWSKNFKVSHQKLKLKNYTSKILSKNNIFTGRYFWLETFLGQRSSFCNRKFSHSLNFWVFLFNKKFLTLFKNNQFSWKMETVLIPVENILIKTKSKKVFIGCFLLTVSWLLLIPLVVYFLPCFEKCPVSFLRDAQKEKEGKKCWIRMDL